jgi:hypothetical protein
MMDCSEFKNLGMPRTLRKDEIGKYTKIEGPV